MKTQSITMQQNVLKTIMTLGFVMLLSLFTNPMNAQTTEKTVTGVVKSTDGVVPMATVILKGTQIWVSCNEHGEFIFPQKLKENDVLIASSLGYQDAEVKITSSTTFVNPFLEDIELIIIGALRTKPTEKASDIHKE
jgi:hypothetical protein